MRISLAWHNTLQNRKRSFAAIAGITFSILLVFMQLGFLQTARQGTTLVYNYFRFDLILTSDHFEALENASWFDQARILQARVVSGVERVSPLVCSRSRWRDLATGSFGPSCLTLGVDLDPEFFPLEDASRLETVRPRGRIMLDRYSSPGFGPIQIGREGTLNRYLVTIGEVIGLGLGFQAEGTAIVSLDTYQNVTRSDPREVTFGLVRIAPGARPEEVKARLQAALPPDVRVFTKAELVRRESDYYINVKPIGIMFRAGAFVALCVGAVILFQVLSTEISNRLKELATLKAVGFTHRYVYGVGVQQALLFTGLSYGPALLFALFVFRVVYWASHIPVRMTFQLALTVLALTAGITIISSVLALQKVRRADPADLF
jgi:putative ABC transport system permease protein